MHNTNLNVETRVIRVFSNFYKSTKKYKAFATSFLLHLYFCFFKSIKNYDSYRNLPRPNKNVSTAF